MTPSTEKNPKYQKTLTPFFTMKECSNRICFALQFIIEKGLNFLNIKSDFR